MSNEELLEQLRRGEGDRQRIMLQLYEQNRPLISQTVKPYLGRGCSDMDDLMQSAYFALCEAVQHYDPDKGRFITYLLYWVKAGAGSAARAAAHAERLPDFMHQRIRDYKRTVSEYQQRTGEPPKDGYICHVMGVSQDQLDQVRLVIRQSFTRSLSEGIPGADGVTLADVIPDSCDRITELCEDIDTATDAAALWAEVAALDERQAAAIRIKYGGHESLSVSATAEQLQLTPGQARSAIESGLQKLRRRQTVQRIGRDHGYSTGDLFCGGLSRFQHSGMSSVEAAVIRRLEGF